MIKVIIIGSGNVAQHLIRAFSNPAVLASKIELSQVFSRQKDKLAHLLSSDKVVTDFKDLAEADLYIMAISDDAIAKVSTQFPFKNRLVVHTSGSVAMTDLDSKNRKGVFYPLQTFTIDKAVDFKTIPICLEAENQSDYAIVEKVAKSISNTVVPIDSHQRKALHVSAVFVNNFVNHLYQIGQEICEENQVPFEILKPLILETVEKIMVLSPKEAQTGPAKRNDIATIESHQLFLSNENHDTIYKILTQSIQHNGTKL
jgi:predicted short-subunit dehydrogenase-like oxidoreductase (DUF2520 family)